MVTTSRGSDSPIKTQHNALSLNEIRNWSRLTRGQPLQLSGIDFSAIAALQAAHREYIRNTSMSLDEHHDFEADRGSDFAQGILDYAKDWDARCATEIGPGLNAVMAAACEQIAPGVFREVGMAWGDWIDDEDTAKTLHPDDQRIVWVPHFALPLVALSGLSSDLSRTWVYFSQYTTTANSPYAQRPPMYAWTTEDVVLTTVFEFIRRAVENGRVNTSQLALAWRSQLSVQPEAYP